MKTENWKSVVGYEASYEVSDFGRVRRINTPCGEPRILSSRENNGGYITCRLSQRSKGKSYLVHKLVMTTFVGSKEGFQVNHINGVKIDNRLENLEYVTRQENIDHAVDTGLMTFKRGLDHWNHKITKPHIDAIFGYLNLGVSQRNAAKLMNINRNTVCRIVTGKHYLSPAV